MNNRIRDLAHEAGLLTYNPEGIPTKLEKFGELIAEHCASMCGSQADKKKSVTERPTVRSIVQN
jgi:hypothetical protein